MRNNLTYFLDLDGVCADFLGGAAKWYGVTDKTIEKDWPDGEWGNSEIISDFFGVGMSEFWDGITNEFWENLEWLPDGREIYELFKPLKPCILTSPATTGASGKQAWIKKNMPGLFADGRYIISPAKDYIAGRDRVLIDDCDLNIEKWAAEGGIGILVPRKWNSSYYVRNSTLAVLKLKLRLQT